MKQVRLPILMYHALGERASPITITRAAFERQMAELHACGCRVVPLQQVVDVLRAGLPLPERAAAITFDDGYAGVYEHAWPVLQRYHFPATVFLVAGYCGRDNRWPDQPASIPRLPLLTWQQVEEMDRGGMTIGAHSLTHASLDRLAPQEAEREIRGGQEIIQDRLGHAVSLFAYPYGRYSRQTRESVARAYTGACGTRQALAGAADDPWALPRVEPAYLIHPLAVRHLRSRGFRIYLQLRGLAHTIVGHPAQSREGSPRMRSTKQ